MLRRRGRIGLIVTAVVGALVLAACGGGGGGGGGNPQGTGNFTFVAGKDTSGYTKALLSGWNAQHPNEQARLIELPEDADSARSQMVTNLSAKSSAYDVMAIDVVWTSEFAKSGWLVALDQSQFPLGQELKPAVETAMFDGKLWGAPFMTNAGLLFYRKDILAKAGKQPPKTFAELKALCPLAQQNSMGCYAGQFFKYEGLTVNFAEAVQAAGGEIMTNSGKTVALDDKAVQGLTFLADGFKQGYIPKDAITYKEEEGRRAFQQGKLLFLRNWPYVYNLANTPGKDSTVAGKVGAVPLPGFTGLGSSSLGGLNLAISTYSKQQKSALKFVKFASTRDVLKATFRISANPTVWADLYDDPTLIKQYPYLSVLKQSLLLAKPRPITPNYQEVTSAIEDNAYAALQGQKSPQQAIDDLKSKLNDIAQNG